ncbi:MAG TPA: GGDEF domain-containing protein [Methylophilaceae bacterium]|nr:GGDEF domain-containing protein [Methylophilaceae bacterium]
MQPDSGPMSDYPSLPEYDFQLVWSDSTLADHLHQYQLTVGDIEAGTFAIDLSAASQLHVSEIVPEAIASCQKLLQDLLAWPEQLNWPDFVAQINRFLNNWIDAYQAGLSFEIGLALSGVIRFTVAADINKSDAFHLYCMSLLAEATNSYQQHLLDHAENHDRNSGLPNLHLLRNQMDTAIAENNQPLGLIIVSFKITSSISHDYHSENPDLIRAISKLIRQNLPENYLLYQIGIAEFCIVLMNLNDAIKLELLAAKLQRAFELTIHVNDTPYALRPTIAGVYKKSPTLFDELYLQARLTLDDALQASKHVAMYSPDLDERANIYAQLEHTILEAFENDRFELYLQPIIDLPEKLCSNAELLLRCKNTNGDFIPPPTIIDVLYKQGFGGRFLRWLLGTTCRMGSEIRKEIGYPVHLSINLAAEDLIDTELPHLLSQSLELWGLEAQYITIEVTENGLLLDEELANKTLQQLVNLGCTLALDDFGTGYSSMTRLRSMPFDLVKVDQSFVRDIHKSNQDFEIVRAIILLAHSLNKTVVAEGVEDADSLQVLKELYCKKIQGYYFSRPLDFKKFIEWINAFQSNMH